MVKWLKKLFFTSWIVSHKTLHTYKECYWVYKNIWKVKIILRDILISWPVRWRVICRLQISKDFRFCRTQKKISTYVARDLLLSCGESYLIILFYLMKICPDCQPSVYAHCGHIGFWASFWNQNKKTKPRYNGEILLLDELIYE